jgi:hypothetical protein
MSQTKREIFLDSGKPLTWDRSTFQPGTRLVIEGWNSPTMLTVRRLLDLGPTEADYIEGVQKLCDELDIEFIHHMVDPVGNRKISLYNDVVQTRKVAA